MAGMKLAMFKNEKKAGDTHPSRTGVGDIDRETLKQLVDAMAKSDDGIIKLECASWDNRSNAGKMYQSIQVKLQDSKYSGGGGGSSGGDDSDGGFHDDDIPF